MFRRRYYVGSTSVVEDRGEFRMEDIREAVAAAQRQVETDGQTRVVVKVVAIVRRPKPLPPPTEVEVAHDEPFK